MGSCNSFCSKRFASLMMHHLTRDHYIAVFVFFRKTVWEKFNNTFDESCSLVKLRLSTRKAPIRLGEKRLNFSDKTETAGDLNNVNLSSRANVKLGCCNSKSTLAE